MMKKSSNPTKTSFVRAKTITVKKARGRKLSSQRWLTRHLNDPYVQQAKAEGYRSRAAFKILEIDQKFKLFKPGQIIVDLGAAPGGWSQIASQQGKVFAIDILPMLDIPGVIFLEGDFLSSDIQEQFQTMIPGPVDVVISDMAASTTGHATTDHIRTRLLAESAFCFAKKVLKREGVFLAKVFDGGTHQELLFELKRQFKQIRHFKPASSRKESPEVYVVCQGFQP